MADEPPPTALARRDAALGPGSTTMLAEDDLRAPVRRSIAAMLQGSVEAFGDVVDALICDLDSTTEGLERVAWLGSTRAVLEKEQAWQAALGQLQWWDQFLAGLPDPELLSERRREEVRRARALRARARLDARQQALEDHRAAVQAELALAERSEADLDPAARRELVRVYDEPEGAAWRVDVAAYEARALAQLAPIPDRVPIVPADLDAAFSFGGFNAVGAMRAHPELGPRAAHMDQAIAQVLQGEFGLTRAAAMGNAQIMTGIFWLALRRALAVGSHQLAASIRLLATAEQGPVQQQFTRELLLSWLAVLEDLPFEDKPRRGGGLRNLLGRGSASQAAAPQLAPAAPKQLGDREQAGVWRKLKKGLGIRED